MKEYVKVKAKCLAEEARIIRLEEKRAKARKKTDLLQGLREHRVQLVRRVARSTLLAYGFLRGTPYKRIEESHREGNEPDWDSVEKMVLRYGVEDRRVLKQRFLAWREAA